MKQMSRCRKTSTPGEDYGRENMHQGRFGGVHRPPKEEVRARKDA